MIRGMMEDAVSFPHEGIQLLPKDRTILERRVTEFRPLGSLNVHPFLYSLMVTSPT